VAVDFGLLSTRTPRTDDVTGIASLSYTAPPPVVGGNSPACPAPNGLPGTCVQIVATPTGPPAVSDYQSASPAQAVVRVVPMGVILPPAGTPTASFTVTPTPLNISVPAIFDASASTPGTNSLVIATYSWSFGDGTSPATGVTVTHTFTTAGTFNVTLTVTNDRGLSQSTSQQVTVGSTNPFTGDWTYSPTPVIVGQAVLFNASAIQSSPGHTVTVANWNFGDGDTTQPTQGILVSHTFAQALTFNVVLTVTDDLGRKNVFAPKAIIVGSGNPVPVITFSPTAPVHGTPGTSISFSSAGTTAFGSSTIVSYSWDFGDGTGSTAANPTKATGYAAPGTYTVRLTVTDSSGRTGTTTVSVTVT